MAIDSRRLRLAAYGTSTTTTNMRRSGKLTLVLVDERIAYYVKGRAAELAAKMTSTHWNAAFECHVEHVTVDEPNEALEPGAYVSGGITYVNPGRAAEMARARLVLDELVGLESRD